MDNAKALRLARDAYTSSTTYFDSSVRKQVETDLNQFNSEHPAGSKYHSDAYKWRSRVFRSKTRATIRKNEAVAAEAFFTTGDVVSISPQDSKNDMQNASAEVMKALLQYRLTKTIPWFMVSMGAYQDAQTVGVVCSHQYWEFDGRKGIDRPCIDLVAIENIRFDPAAKWHDPVGTSPYFIELIPMYVKDVKARMQISDDPRRKSWLTVSDSDILSASKQSSDTIRLTREPNRTDSQDQSPQVTDYSIVWVHRNIIEDDGQDVIFYTLGCEKLLSEPVPLKSEYFHGKRPYVIGRCIIETHKNYPSGVAKITKEIQGEINELANQGIDATRFALNPRYFVKRGKRVDLRSLTRNVPSGVTLMDDPSIDAVMQKVDSQTSHSFQDQDRLNLDFDDIAGSFSGSSVQSNRKLNETVGGMNLLSTTANQVSGYQLRTFTETWMEPALRQLILLEQEYETDDIILALAAQQAQLMQKFGIDTITDELLRQELTLTVNVGMGATNPNDKVNTLLTGMNGIKTVLADGVLEKYGVKPVEVITEILGVLGYKNGGRFFDDGGDEDRGVKALKQQIAQLQQALDAKNPPELLAAQVKKLEAEATAINSNSIAKKVEAMYSAMQAAGVIAATPSTSPLADALLGSAGFVDANSAPVVPVYNGVPTAPVDVGTNTSPMQPAIPASPAEGINTGIETQRTTDGITT